MPLHFLIIKVVYMKQYILNKSKDYYFYSSLKKKQRLEMYISYDQSYGLLSCH